MGCGALLLVTLVLLGVLRSSSTSTSNSGDSSAQVKAQAHEEELRNYKSTKPVSEMDGQEQHEYNEAYRYMTVEERKKQVRRDFGDLSE
jgi:hypothetical protein